MEQIDDYFQGIGDYNLFYKSWAVDKPKAVVQIVHGFCEHSGRYANLIDHLIKEKFAVFIHDNKGHGKSEGTRNHIITLDTFAEDAHILTEKILKKYPNIPLFLIGHSMGSLVAQRYAIKFQKELKGLILSGSGTSPPDFPKILEIFAKIMVKIAPKLKGDAGIVPENISSDPESVEDYKTDPLIDHKNGTVGMGIAMMNHYKEIKEEIGKIQIPVLMQRGSDDVMMIGEKELFEDLKTEDKEFIVYKNAKHEVYTEIKEIREKAFNDVTKWITARL
ncbi:MAG: lysophospholipase [Candidatus Heimdallarchaeaceae archaeon]